VNSNNIILDKCGYSIYTLNIKTNGDMVWAQFEYGISDVKEKNNVRKSKRNNNGAVKSGGCGDFGEDFF